MQRILTFKLITMVLLALLLLVPLALISGKVNERRAYRQDAVNTIAYSWAGSQQVLGPVLVVPYTERVLVREWDKDKERYFDKEQHLARTKVLLPQSLEIDGKLATELRYLGIHQVPVYAATLALSGQFTFDEIKTLLRDPNVVKVGDPLLAVHLSDPVGLTAIPRGEWNGKAIELEGAGSLLSGMEAGVHGAVGKVDRDGGPVSFRLALDVRGIEQLTLSPVGKSTTVALSSPWPHPRFTGRILPVSRDIGVDGFTARWQTTSQVARMAGNCPNDICPDFLSAALGVTLVDPVDAYLETERSLKYGLLFVGLTFIGCFLVEVLRRLRIHPVQYLLVGTALTMFYLLLLSLAEHIGFGRAYLAATAACVALLGYYLTHALRSAKLGGLFSLALAALYGVLFVIISAEDYALLMGSGLIFASLAAVMHLTRRLDWYQVGERMQGRVPSEEQ